ncbi:MAG: hypothetical protein USCAAHI_01358 [Beijerinckiaceae bacterium]|nr:MAG: hypothetical protein USCAAHI_01358 [Beijerinckiaceae bacterium]
MARADHARAASTFRCAIYTRKSSEEGLMSAAEATALRVNDTARRPVRGTENLFSWYRLGELELRNRMVLSPMTRSRAINGNRLPRPTTSSALPRASSSPKAPR